MHIVKKKNFWFEIEVSFYDVISVFLHWTFCTCSTATALQLYFHMKYGFVHNPKVIQIIASPWIITKQLKQLIKTAHWKKILWFEIEVSFYDVISVFLHWTFRTCSTATVFQLYFHMKYGFVHNPKVIQIIASPWIITKQLKQLIKTTHWKKKLVRDWSVLLWCHKCLFTLNFLYMQYCNCFSAVFSHEIWICTESKDHPNNCITMNHHQTTKTTNSNCTLKKKILVRDWTVLLWCHKCVFTLNFLYIQYCNCFSAVFSHEIWICTMLQPFHNSRTAYQ